MGKKLSEMTLEELWALFPIILAPHNPEWADWYAEGEALIRRILPENALCAVSHIGSTAIAGIWAKPIIDILIEIQPGCSLNDLNALLIQNGYICMSQSEKRYSLNKGYTEKGFAERVFHLHLRLAGDNSELYFRDYLNEHPSAAREYEALKLRLWKKYEHNRDGYTQAKGELVTRLTALARAAYPGRYTRP